MSRQLLLAVGSLAVCAVLILLVDAAVGRLRNTDDLLFEHGTAAHYESDEFSFTARINDLGLRDHPMQVARSTRHRVLALGDSFTFGWGVALEDSWPKRLEQLLRARGLDVEVVNAGRSGDSPWQYASNAERLIPALEPDLVLAAVLQGDDLAQLVLGQGRNRRREGSAPSTGWDVVYPANLVDVLRAVAARSPEDIAETWRAQAETFAETLEGPARRARYERIAPEIRASFEAGRLNPALVTLAVKHPRYFRFSVDLEAPRTRRAIEVLAETFERIAAAARAQGAGSAVASVPLGAYVSPAKHASYRATGLVLEPTDLTTDAMDEAIARAALAAGVPFIEVTAAFRLHGDDPPLFFAHDGHFTPAGSRLYAESLAPFVADLLSTPPADQ